MKFDHIIITRFNVLWSMDSIPADEDWLRHRLSFFRSVCCPSVMSQSNKNFRWVVLFDSAREDWFETEINTLSKEVPFEPVWVQGPLTPEVYSTIAADRCAADWLITSRLDNDDAISRDYVKLIQSQFRGQAFEFINFRSGLQLTETGELFRSFDPSNPFISLIEKRTSHPPRCVYLAPHTDVERHGNVIQLKSHPMWLQMLHGRNLGNGVQGIRADPAMLTEYFDIKLAALPVSRLRLLADTSKSATSLAWRVVQKPSRLSRLGKLARDRLKGAVTESGG